MILPSSGVNLKAFDNKGTLLEVKKTDENTWTIPGAKKLYKITYLVNDTFDSEKGAGFGQEDIFSPAGTNIEAGTNFMVNMHGFVGYFQDKKEIPYRVNITHPETLWGATSMIDLDSKNNSDEFVVSRYGELVENPVMYAKPDYTTFTVEGMDITIAVFSPGKKVCKGDEKGFFKFGGSTIVLFIEKDRIKIDEEIINQSYLGFETKVQMGEKIGTKK